VTHAGDVEIAFAPANHSLFALVNAPRKIHRAVHCQQCRSVHASSFTVVGFDRSFNPKAVLTPRSARTESIIVAA
jgi:hypothetical protein